MTRLFVLCAAFAMIAAPASATGIEVAIGAALSAASSGATIFGAISAGLQVFGSTLFGKLFFAAAFSLVGQALQKKPTAKQSGFQIPGTTAGEAESQTIQLGTRLTGGHIVYRNSWGTYGSAKNAYLVEVIELGDMPGVELKSLVINDELVDFDPQGTAHPDFGVELPFTNESGVRLAWAKFYDGTQTTADPYLVDKFSAETDYAWTTDHIGTGTPYVILTYLFNRKQFKGRPRSAFVHSGIPLYDPRKDTTAGGSGAHRWADQTTWEPSDNSGVQDYNLLRGIPLPTGEVYGGRITEPNVPLSNHVAAMNVCDVDVDGRLQFRTSVEIEIANDEPKDVIQSILSGSEGRIAETGGVWRVRHGGPAAPVRSFTAGDLSISDPRSFDPIKGLESTYNAVVSRYIDPESLWQPRGTDILRNAAWEAEDDGQLLTLNLDMESVFSRDQANQVQAALVTDNRRHREVGMVLPPDALDLEPLDDVTLSHESWGFTDKDFEVGTTVFRLMSGMVEVGLRERDPADFSPDLTLEQGPLPAYSSLPDQDDTVPVLTLSQAGVPDSSGTNIFAAVEVAWDGAAGAQPSDLIRWQGRDATTEQFLVAGVNGVDEGSTLTSPLGGNLGLEFRARFVTDAPSAWSDWVPITTLPISLSGGLSIALSSETISVPADNDGANPDLSEAETTITVLNGTTDDTSNWTLARTNGTGVTSTLTSGTLDVTGLTVDSGHVDITATRSGFPTLTKRLTLSKAKAGATGATGATGDTGDPGADAINIVISPAAVTLPATQAGVVTDYAGSGCRISVEEGNSPLSSTTGTLTAGTWKINSIGVYTDGATSTDITPGSVSDSGNDLLVANHSAMADGVDTVKIVYFLNYRNANNDFGTLDVSQTISKAKAGDDGSSVKSVTAYQRAASAPSTPTGGSYDFGANTLTPPAGWSADAPGTDGNPLWASTATAAVAGSTGTDSSLTWSAPIKLVEDGADGADGADGTNGTDGDKGDTQVTGRVYYQTLQGTAPDAPTATGYDSGTGQLTELTAGWSQQQPAVEVTDTTVQEWSAPFTVTIDGVTSGVTVSFGSVTGAIQINSDIQSDNFVAGTSGWQIKRDTGEAEFGATSIRGKLTAAQVDIDGVTLTSTGSNALALAGTIQSDNFVAGTSGWQINRTTGAAELDAATIRGLLQADQIKIDNVTLDTDGAGTLIIANSGVDTAQIGANAVTKFQYQQKDTTTTIGTTGTSWTTTFTKDFSVTAEGDLLVKFGFTLRTSGADPLVATSAWIKGQYKIEADIPGLGTYTRNFDEVFMRVGDTRRFVHNIPLSQTLSRSSGTLTARVMARLNDESAGAMALQVIDEEIELIEGKR